MAGPQSRIAAVHPVLPEHRYSQDEITEALTETIGGGTVDGGLLRRIHAHSGVEQRHLALPLEQFADLRDFGKANDAFIETATELGSQAVAGALAEAGLRAADVNVIISTTVTGVAVPSLEARVATRLGMRRDVARVPLLGAGCAGGAAGMARAHEYLAGHRDHVAVLVSVELCSLTVQHQDTSPANLVASGLFGDGAAAVVMTGSDARPGSVEAGPGPRVVGAGSCLYPDTERALGWDVGSTGLKIVLGVEVPRLVRAHAGADIDRFLDAHGLTRADIEWWVAHPGGPKVLEALQEALALPREAFGGSWQSLARVGNLSSSSVLHILADTLATAPPRPGSYGLLLAMGPGFALEMVLLQSPLS